MSQVRVFVSGVAGFIGSHVADRILARGGQVVGVDSLIYGGDLSNLDSRIEFHRADVRDINALRPLFTGVDLVLHASALAYDGLSVTSPFLISENNFACTAALASLAAQTKVKRFVFCSSMARYGELGNTFVEDALCRPVTPYGISKCAEEQMLRNVAESHGFEWAIGVPHNVVGPRQRYDDPYRNVVAIMINRLLQDQAPIIYGDGEQERAFSSIWDTVDVFESLLFANSAAGEVVNIGPDEEVITVNELARRLNQLTKKNLMPIHMPSRPREVKTAVCCAKKARRLFNYNTKRPLQATLEEMVYWIEKQGPKPFKYNLPLEIVDEETLDTWRKKSI